MQRLPMDRDQWAQFLRHSRLDLCSLGDADPLADERPGGGLIGRIEEHRAEARVATLQTADHRVTLPHGRETASVDIE